MIRTVLMLVACVAIAGAQTDSAADSGNGTIAFTGVHVHVGDGSEIEGATILVAGGKIRAVGVGVEIPEGADRRDMKGAHVTPGLIDAAASGLIGRAATEQISENVAGWRVVDGLDLHSEAMKTLAAEGVTTVFVTASPSSVFGCQAAVVKTGEGDSSGRILVTAGPPKLVLSHAPSSGNGRPSSRKTVYTRRPTSQMGVNFVARDVLAQTREALRKKDPEIDADTRVLGEVLARKRTIRVLAEEQYELATALRLSREWGFDFVVENAGEAWRFADQLKAAGVPVVFGPVVKEPTPPGPMSRFRMRREPELKLGTPALLHEKGLRLCLTAAGQTGEWGLVRQATAAVRYGMPRKAALAAVTSEAAKLIGVADRTGRIAKGLDADLVVWSGLPFESTSRARAIMIDGRDVKPRIL